MNNIEILEEFIEDYIHGDFVIQDRVMRAIENLIKENKELKKENLELHKEINQRIKLKLENERCADKDFIPKLKVKEKIEKLERQKETVIDELNFKAFYKITDLKNVEIGILKQLLEEGE